MQAATSRGAQTRVWITAALLVALLFFVIASVILTTKWPFREGNVEASLRRATRTHVHFVHLEQKFFPNPGCVLDTLTFTRGHGEKQKTLATASRLDMETSWASLFTFRKHLTYARVDNLVVTIPVEGALPREEPFGKNSNKVDQLVADGAVLNVMRENASALRFEFPKLSLGDLSTGTKIQIDAEMRNPEPRGDVSFHGALGPIRTDDGGQTPVKGSFVFDKIDISRFDGLTGLLTIKSDVSGPLNHLEMRGTGDTPNLEVNHSGHREHFTAAVHAFVNGLNGDTHLESIASHFLNSDVSASGDVAGEGTKKTISLQVNSKHARIQDLLSMAMASRPGLTGNLEFSGHFLLPAGPERFLKRVRFGARAGLQNADFTSPGVQGSMDVLSDRARGGKPSPEHEAARVAATVESSIDVRDGVTKFGELRLQMPGARARLDGTYNLISEQINLEGKLATDAKLSQDTSGFKSFFLKPFNPLFKGKHGAGAVVPIYVTGSIKHPNAGVSLMGKR